MTLTVELDEKVSEVSFREGEVAAPSVQRVSGNTGHCSRMLPRTFLASLPCLIAGLLFTCAGGLLAIFWTTIYRHIVASNLQLTPDGASFQIWKDTPVPMYIEFYFFNWTNPHEISEEGKKPSFQEIGPYRFIETKEKTGIVWNDNATISFTQERRWYYDPDNSNGSLSDALTTINIVALTAAYVSRDWNYFLVLPLSQLLKSHSVHITHTVSEFLFEGFNDPLITMGKVGSVFAKDVQVPYDKFGWFYTRNGSSDFDGYFNMATGVGDISQMGVLKEWNYKNWTKYYPDSCGEVKGSAGELFPPQREKNEAIGIYSPDICRSMYFDYSDDVTVSDIRAYRYAASPSNLDNGTLDPANNCYCGGECVPSGVVNVSTCRFGAPAFVSYPHFYQADPYYLEQVDGLKPEKDKHSFYMSLEPTTGIPLEVSARLQINVLMQPYKAITLFEKLPKLFFPMMWFQQRATVTPELASSLQQLLILLPLGSITAIVMLTIGFTTLLLVAVLYWNKKQPLKASKLSEKTSNSEVISPLMIKTIDDTIAGSVYFDAGSEKIMDSNRVISISKRNHHLS